MSKKNQAKRIHWQSITVKWTVLSSAVIFILFTALSLIIYYTSSNLLVREERENFSEIMTQIQERLEMSDRELTISNSIRLLKNTVSGNKPGSYPQVPLEANAIRLDSFISELSQKDLTVKLYNTKEEMIFETRGITLPFTGKDNVKISVQSFDGYAGFVQVLPVYSDTEDELVGYVQGFYELTSYYDIRRDLFRLLLVFEIIGLVVSLLLGFLLSTYFTKPMKKIVKTLDSVKGDPLTNERVTTLKGEDEFSDLAESFNDMLDKMQLFVEQQKEFVEDVSHELRTPVAVIEGHLNLLNRWGKDDPEVLEESLQASLQEITRMKKLVQEMLDLSRAEQVEFQHRNESCNAKEVLNQNVNNFRMLHPEFYFILDDDLPDTLQVKMYRNHFEQVLIILMDNAVKYSRDRKEVSISASHVLNRLDIIIQDFGEGISEENQKKIFNRFYRVDKARARNTGGNGLGLSIAQQLVESYNGRISVKSVEGQGSSFRVVLPTVADVSKDEHLL